MITSNIKIKYNGGVLLRESLLALHLQTLINAFNTRPVPNRVCSYDEFSEAENPLRNPDLKSAPSVPILDADFATFLDHADSASS